MNFIVGGPASYLAVLPTPWFIGYLTSSTAFFAQFLEKLKFEKAPTLDVILSQILSYFVSSSSSKRHMVMKQICSRENSICVNEMVPTFE